MSDELKPSVSEEMRWPFLVLFEKNHHCYHLSTLERPDAKICATRHEELDPANVVVNREIIIPEQWNSQSWPYEGSEWCPACSGLLFQAIYAERRERILGLIDQLQRDVSDAQLELLNAMRMALCEKLTVSEDWGTRARAIKSLVCSISRWAYQYGKSNENTRAAASRDAAWRALDYLLGL